MTNRKLIAVFAIVFSVFVIAAFIVNSIQPEDNIAVITVNGEKVKEVDLTYEQTFNIETERGKNTVSVKEGTIYVEDASCPDKLCMRHGKLHNKYDAIVCLPNKVVIEYKNSGQVDAVAGR